MSTKLQRIAEQAVREPEKVFTTLAHLIDVEFLREAYRRTQKNCASGVDGVTAEQYAENLDQNLQDLHERLRSGRYVAPPVKRVWLEEDEGKRRPIGMASFEDKIAQRAVVMVMGAVFEQDFKSFSHGYRKGHSPHQALAEVREKCMEMGIKWIADVDVTGFFDNLGHGWIMSMIKRRINDGAILRLIGKWLNAGVMEGLELTYPEKGTPQGGVVSPMIANIYLHYALDTWYVQAVKPRLRGRSFLIRFADDFIIGCEREEDARRVMEAVPERFKGFGLSINRKKTALVRFGKPAWNAEADSGNGTFDFLGFTHYWSKARRGYWVIKRQTMGKRVRRTQKSFWNWCRNNRHMPLKEQHGKLCHKLRGYYQYYGIRCNFKMLEVVMEHVERAWRYWLSRRSNKSTIAWDKFQRLRKLLALPMPRIIHNV